MANSLSASASILPQSQQTLNTLFDYQELDAETRIVVQQRTSEIKALMKRTAQDIIEIGEKLIEVKGRLGHGRFGAWLEAEFEWKPTTAWNFMRVAEKFSNFENLPNFAPSALYLLAAPSTPDEARTEAIARAQAGETITHSAAKEIVNSYKPSTNGSHQTATYEDTRPLFAEDLHLDSALEDESKPVCPECGQVYDGSHCPDCRPQNGYNYKRDNKNSAPRYTPEGLDACQTPAYALDPLSPYLPEDSVIWEPACGEGLLEDALFDSGFQVVSGDLQTGQDFFEYEPDHWSCQVTNPPFSKKFPWLKRCYELGKPFALLLPVETLGAKTAQEMFDQFGVEIIFLDRRINFKMPYAGWEGKGAQFPVAWFTWGLNIGKQMTFAKVVADDQPG